MKAILGRSSLMLAVLLSGLFVSSVTSATTTWTDWTSASTGNPGSAGGTLNGVAVNYSGEVLSNRVINGSATNWLPNSSFIGGTVTDSPSTVGDIITLAGAFTGTNTITFASPILNPVLAIWSLGAGSPASFMFNQAPTFEAGGPNAQFGGGPITISGNTVTGREGNGVAQFSGSVTSISWTDTPEFYYGFTVGTAGAVPEPSAYLLLGAGLALVAFAVRRVRR